VIFVRVKQLKVGAEIITDSERYECSIVLRTDQNVEDVPILPEYG
jgi:hypothetical protein